MAVTFKSLSYVTDPANPEMNDDIFITAPSYDLTFEYYTNTPDDDLAIICTNKYQAIGSTIEEVDLKDFTVTFTQGAGSFISDELVGTLNTTPLPSIALPTLLGYYWRNQMVRIETTPVPFPPPSSPTYQYVGKAANNGNTIILYNEFSNSATNPVPAGTRIYSPKILKTVSAKVFFTSPLIKSGIYTIQLQFKHTFTGDIIKSQDYVFRYAETEATGLLKSFTQHQWGYVNIDIQRKMDCGRIILTHDMPPIFNKADEPFNFKIIMRGFYNSWQSDVMNDSYTFSFTAKTDLNKNGIDNLDKVIQ